MAETWTCTRCRIRFHIEERRHARCESGLCPDCGVRFSHGLPTRRERPATRRTAPVRMSVTAADLAAHRERAP